jgi:hypothetical protein
VKKAAAMSDPEWREAAEAVPEVGLKIWRIEKFEGELRLVEGRGFRVVWGCWVSTVMEGDGR